MSFPITTKVVSSNPVYGEVYSIQHYVIKFISDLQQVGGFSPCTPKCKYNWCPSVKWKHNLCEVMNYLEKNLSTTATFLLLLI